MAEAELSALVGAARTGTPPAARAAIIHIFYIIFAATFNRATLSPATASHPGLPEGPSAMTLKAPFKLVFLILACLLFLLAGVAGPWAPAPPEWPWRGRLVAFGLFCWTLSELVA
jgi:hypothetical protein